MGSLMQDFKRQASFFLREKIKTARLALTDTTYAQLLTEELINGDSMATDVHAMRVISRAAFEVDDYERIVQILHQRLSKFEVSNWRASYKALVLLEHLLTHGPQRTAEEFEHHQDSITTMATFHHVDEKGFNWGSSVKNKSERIVKLLQDREYLKEERTRARKLTVGIKGFGSFSHGGTSSTQADTARALRSKSLEGFTADHPPKAEDNDDEDEFPGSDEYTKLMVANKGWMSRGLSTSTYALVSGYVEEEDRDHPFWDKEHRTRASLLSTV
ncbi:epsin-3-like [Andrographis paniculata]|uniref:epsin-3-like n=1 Tax=Andrographis paniculata TaxID=175694 RepID=UPI0021E80C58|nr:epsin-3-like [Andrographis paniculata]